MGLFQDQDLVCVQLHINNPWEWIYPPVVVGFEQVSHLSARYLVRGADSHQNHSLLQGSANFSVKSQILNILGFVGHVVSVTTSQLRHHRAKAATGKAKANEHSWVIVKMYL